MMVSNICSVQFRPSTSLEIDLIMLNNTLIVQLSGVIVVLAVFGTVSGGDCSRSSCERRCNWGVDLSSR